jgi:hypothetical protein
MSNLTMQSQLNISESQQDHDFQVCLPNHVRANPAKSDKTQLCFVVFVLDRSDRV